MKIFKTIKIKLSFVFLFFMAAFVLCNILLGTMFLEKFYIYKNRDIFIEDDKIIRAEYKNNYENIADVLIIIDRIDGIKCMISDRDFEVKFASASRKMALKTVKVPNEIQRLVKYSRKLLQNSYVYSIVEGTEYKVTEIVYVSAIGEDDLLVMIKPMKGIVESTGIAYQFFIFSGIILICIGSIFIYLFARKITKPIVEMSHAARAISDLDFNIRVSIDTQDEIGSLGNSINKISRELSTAVDDLRKDVERRKLLVRNLSHELKTPIGIIKGYTEGLKFGITDDKEKAQKYCTIIAEECDRMDGMVRELLNLSMLESGTFQINITTFDTGEFVQKVVERFSPVLNEKGIAVEIKCEKGYFISADCELLKRVLNNLITNAINHVEGKKHIIIGVERKGDGTRISVFNTGTHIPQDELENIWDVFYKVDKARSRKYGGHGLGLSIVRLIAQLHRGICGVENVHEGVRFYIEIP